eukprot:GHVS01002979.1.p1 GENE.GHVS01002979.1~~GHVS01002979.1.p1  ORF type:complete len:988 (+),score=132.87 GHVS01002979.1:236-2965(+)
MAEGVNSARAMGQQVEPADVSFVTAKFTDDTHEAKPPRGSHGGQTMGGHNSPKKQKNLHVETLLFFHEQKLTRAEDGHKATVKLPRISENFEVRAFVVMKAHKPSGEGISGLKWGSERKEFTPSTTTRLSLVAHSPRVRLYDEFTVGVIVSKDKNKTEERVILSMAFGDKREKQLTLTEATTEVLWSVHASTIDEPAEVTITISTIAEQEEVTITKSAVDVSSDDDGSKEEQWTEVDAVTTSIRIVPLFERVTSVAPVLLDEDAGAAEYNTGSTTTAGVKRETRTTVEVQVPEFDFRPRVAVIAGMGFKGVIESIVDNVMNRVVFTERENVFVTEADPDGQDVLAIGYAGALLPFKQIMTMGVAGGGKADEWVEKREALMSRFDFYVHQSGLGFLSSTVDVTLQQVKNSRCMQAGEEVKTGLDCCRLDVELTAGAIMVGDAVAKAETGWSPVMTQPSVVEVVTQPLVQEEQQQHPSGGGARWAEQRKVLLGAISKYLDSSLRCSPAQGSCESSVDDETLAYLYYALGSNHEFDLKEKNGDRVSFNKLRETCFGDTTTTTLKTCLLVALTVTKAEGTNNKNAIAIRTLSLQLAEKIMTTKGETGLFSSYFSSDDVKVPLMEQALGIQLLMSPSECDQNVLDNAKKVATFVSQQSLRKDGNATTTLSGLVLIEVLNGLLAVDKKLLEMDKTDNPKVKVAPSAVKPATSILAVETAIEWNCINSKTTTSVTFLSEGKGTLLALLSIQYYLRQNDFQPISRGIYVIETHLQYDRTTGKCEGPAKWSAVRWTFVCSVLEVRLTESLFDVEVIQEHPTGLELTDHFPAVERELPAWTFPQCFKETSQGQTVWRCQYLSRGHHTFTSVLSANQLGTYGCPPAIVRSQRNPDVMGSSNVLASGFVVVESDVKKGGPQ